MVRNLHIVCWMPLILILMNHSLFTSPPTEKPMAIITSTAKWRWPIALTILDDRKIQGLPTMLNFFQSFLPPMKLRFMRTARGVVCMALNDGGPTVDVIPANLIIINDGESLLRESLDWLTRPLRDIYELEASFIMKDPWKAREDYINVILNRNDETIKTS